MISREKRLAVVAREERRGVRVLQEISDLLLGPVRHVRADVSRPLACEIEALAADDAARVRVGELKLRQLQAGAGDLVLVLEVRRNEVVESDVATLAEVADLSRRQQPKDLLFERGRRALG